MAEHGPSEVAVAALRRHLQSEWAGPYMARIRDFSAEEIAAGKLREADALAESEAHKAARAALAAAHDPALGLDRSVCLRDVVEELKWYGTAAGTRGLVKPNHIAQAYADFVERAFTEQPSSPEGEDT